MLHALVRQVIKGLLCVVGVAMGLAGCSSVALDDNGAAPSGDASNGQAFPVPKLALDPVAPKDRAPVAKPAGAGESGGPTSAIVSQLPALPLLIEAIDDPGQNCWDLLPSARCQAGPWLLAVHALEDGSLEGALASLDPAVPANEPPEAWPIHLEPAGGGVFASYSTPLKTYHFLDARVPGMCLDNRSKFTFYDDTADGIADRVQLSGRFATQGMVSADYDTSCRNLEETGDLATSGRPLSALPRLVARGDALQPFLEIRGGFLKRGDATLRLPSGQGVAAKPLEIGGLVYGFSAEATLVPGSTIAWQLSEPESIGEPLAETDLQVEVEAWPTVTDASLEQLTSGIRLARPAGTSRLVFLSLGGSPVVDLGYSGAIGPRAALHMTSEAADCREHQSLCDATTPGDLREYSVDLEPGTADVLLRVHDGSACYGCGVHDFLVGQLRFEGPASPRLTVPEAPFRINAINDPNPECADRNDCIAGPWTLGLHTAVDGTLSGILAAIDGSSASPIRLEPEGSRYRVLGGAALGPGLCLSDGQWRANSASYFEFLDNDGDQIADHVDWAGGLLNTPDASRGCLGDRVFELQASGQLNDSPPHAELLIEGRKARVVLDTLLVSASATLEDSEGNPATDSDGNRYDVYASDIDGWIFEFRMPSGPLGPAPGSHLVWKLDGVDAAGRAVTPASFDFVIPE